MERGIGFEVDGSGHRSGEGGGRARGGESRWLLGDPILAGPESGNIVSGVFTSALARARTRTGVTGRNRRQTGNYVLGRKITSR